MWGSVSPGHLAVTRAGPRGGLSPGSHLGCPHRSEFRPAAAGDRVAGRAAACREEPPSHRTQAPLQHRGTGERTGRSAFWRRGAVRPRVCRGSQGAGTPGPGVPGRARGLLAAHPGISLAGPRACAPPPGSLRVSHLPRRARHPLLTASLAAAEPLAGPAQRRLRGHRKRFSRHGGPARSRRPERVPGARPRAQPRGPGGGGGGADAPCGSLSSQLRLRLVQARTPVPARLLPALRPALSPS